MSKIDSKIYTGGESISNSQLGSIMDPTKLSAELKNMEGDVMDRPIKYAKPKYSEVKKTYKVLEPITKETIVLPTKESKKIRETKPVFQEPIYVSGKDGLKAALQNPDYSNIPLPTASVINNLCQSSVVQSNYYSESQIYKSKNDNPALQSKISNNAKNSVQQSKSIQDTKKSGIDKPVVYEGQSIKQSAQKDNNIQSSMKNSNIGNSNLSNVQKSNYSQLNNASVHQSKVNQSKNYTNQSNQSNLRNQPPMHQSNMYQQSNHQSRVQQSESQKQSIHQQSIKQSNVPQQSVKQSNMQQQSVKQSNVPQQSIHQSNNIGKNQINQSNASLQTQNQSIKMSVPQQSQVQNSKINQSNMNNQQNVYPSQSNLQQQSTHQSKMQQSNVQ